MNLPYEHDDDLESEVAEGAAIETEQYEGADDDEGVVSGADNTNASKPSGGSSTDDEVPGEPEDESSDTI